MKYSQKPVICLVGLGYVGLPLAVLFAKKGLKTYGYDIKEKRVEELKKGIDISGEISKQELSSAVINYSTNPEVISRSNFIVVAVPTPVDESHQPDLTPLVKSSEVVGKFLKQNSVVVFESTVYPGATEEVCVPIIEKFSKLKCGEDWVIGYSPERINPGDKDHTPEKIVKVTSGMDTKSSDYIDMVYRQIIEAGTFKASNIKTAEAAKVIENTQRDINIAIVNEFAVVFDKLGINTFEVLEAAKTKWSFLNFRPGLVGGHCIGVDPYYLIHRAETYGYCPRLMIEARNVNEEMVTFCSNQILRLLISAGKVISSSKILIMGATFKENVRDTRNSKVFSLIENLNKLGIKVFVFDPHLEFEDIKDEVCLEKSHFINDLKKVKDFDGICYAVNHEAFKIYELPDLRKLCGKNPVFFDIKGRFINSPEKPLFTYGSI